LSIPAGPAIIHIDHFGNLITNITRDAWPDGASLLVNGNVIRSFRSFYGELTGAADGAFGIWGSAGFLEIAVNGGSAADVLRAKRGDPIEIQV
jgi:S-adenosylmethionine hydrolase